MCLGDQWIRMVSQHGENHEISSLKVIIYFIPETHQCLTIWFQRRLCKSTLTTQSSSSWGRKPMLIGATRPLRTLSGYFSTLPYWPQDSHWMNHLHSPTESIEWSNWVSQLMMTKLSNNYPPSKRILQVQDKPLPTRCKKLTDYHI